MGKLTHNVFASKSCEWNRRTAFSSISDKTDRQTRITLEALEQLAGAGLLPVMTAEKRESGVEYYDIDGDQLFAQIDRLGTHQAEAKAAIEKLCKVPESVNPERAVARLTSYHVLSVSNPDSQSNAAAAVANVWGSSSSDDNPY